MIYGLTDRRGTPHGDHMSAAFCGFAPLHKHTSTGVSVDLLTASGSMMLSRVPSKISGCTNRANVCIVLAGLGC